MPSIKKSYAELFDFAKKASEQSYSPYSKMKVGAAVLCSDGKVYCGANVENASYGLTVCAERSAVFTAVSNGSKDIIAVAVYSKGGIVPCGACRQVIYEFSPEADVVYGDKNTGRLKVKKITGFLPDSFCGKKLK